METYDVVVVGAGPGGYPAAIRAAQLGAKTAIIEREQLGGTCLNWGCIPTKSLIAGADLYFQARHAEGLGLKADGVTVDYAAMYNHKQDVVAKLQKGIEGLLKANGVDVIRGEASFLGRDRLLVSGAEASRVVMGKKIILATGSTSIVPGFLPKHERVVDSRAFLDRTELPESMIVMGGGYIGCELACMAAMLGVKVTIVELLDDILMLLDADVRREVRKGMEKKLGIRIMTGKALEEPKACDQGVTCKVGDETLSAELLLASVGRKAVTNGLRLDCAGLSVTEKGTIEVDEVNRTAVANIYAIGDVNGIIQLAHAATSQGVIAAEHAVTGQAPANETLIPGVIFTTPEVAVIGLTEDEAKAQGREVKVGKFPFMALGRALAAGHPEGFVKWIADPETEQLLGAQVVGAHATDLIAEAGVAIRSELTAKELGRIVHAHPTFGEVWMEGVHALEGTCIHAAPRKR